MEISVGNKDAVPDAILFVEFIRRLRGLLESTTLDKPARQQPTLLQKSTARDHRICMVKMRYSDIFLDGVDVTSLQRTPFPSCILKQRSLFFPQSSGMYRLSSGCSLWRVVV